MTAARVVLLRHGRTGHNHAGMWQGQLDIPLDDVGRAQAAAAAEGLGRRVAAWVEAGETVRLVSSDLSRAYDTALASTNSPPRRASSHSRVSATRTG